MSSLYLHLCSRSDEWSRLLKEGAELPALTVSAICMVERGSGMQPVESVRAPYPRISRSRAREKNAQAAYRWSACHGPDIASSDTRAAG